MLEGGLRSCAISNLLLVGHPSALKTSGVIYKVGSRRDRNTVYIILYIIYIYVYSFIYQLQSCMHDHLIRIFQES